MNKKKYDHYELFLGVEQEKAKLLDPPGNLRLLPFHKLTPRWKGTGLIVSTQPINLDKILAPARKRLLMYSAFIFGFVLTVHLLKQKWWTKTISPPRKKLAFSAMQLTGFTVISILAGFGYHFIKNDGLLANNTEVGELRQAHKVNFIPKVNEQDVRNLLDTETLFVDARLSGDFNSDHLPGAINVPANVNNQKLQETMADINKNRHIVVYCQSAGCRFAEKVAVKLMEKGFSNVSIFRGGWRKWVADKNKSKEKSL